MADYDIIIVGAGSAGCVLAARLSEVPDLRVALVEAGGPATDAAIADLRIADPAAWPALQGSAIDWRFATAPQRHTAGRVHGWPRGRVIGGSSCLNAMAHVRGHATDFDGWAAAGCTGWSYRDLLPYFIRSETWPGAPSPYHGTAGPIRLLTPAEPHPITRATMAAGEERGLAPTDEHNGARMAGPTLNTLTLVDGRRQSVADAYLTPALGRPNLTVIAGATVHRLAMADDRCTGVAIARAGVLETLAADRVILAAGAIGSPVILQRSGIGPAAALRGHGIAVGHDLPGVGANLQDHLLAGGNVYRAKRPVPPSKYQHSESLTYVGGADDAAAPELVLACVVVPVVTEAFTAPPLGAAYTIMFGFTRPRSRGTVRLGGADVDAPPLIDPNYLAEPYDREAYLAALDMAQAVGAARALADWRAGELLPGPDVKTRAARLAFLEQAAATHHHPVGTCAMGTGSDAVVGPDLAVHGLAGLTVVDASVMPRIPTGPVNAAVVAIAERASDLLRGRAPLAPVDPTRL